MAHGIAQTLNGLDCEPGSPVSDDQECNGQDDDCDGQVDENFVSGNRSYYEGVRSEAMDLCVNGAIQSQCVPLQPWVRMMNVMVWTKIATVELMRGINTGIVCGTGACQRDGETVCVNGQEQAECRPGGPNRYEL